MEQKKEDTQGISQRDWDISEEYYQAEEGKEELKLEDFMEPEDSELTFRLNGDIQIQQTSEDVRQVMRLAKEGKTVKEISEELFLEEEYVYNIQICAQSIGESDPISIAHMILIGQ